MIKVAWIEQHPEAVISAISFLFGAITWIIQRQSGRKLINYRVHHDMQIEAEPAVEDMAELVVRRENEDVPEAGMVLLRVRNSGRDKITKEDFERPLSFTFPDRKIIAAKVSEPEPPRIGGCVGR